ncbi:antiterminator Q family protein [Enterobacter huaxiensis]|uniref:antiterminator Q family protein n=1 Tax=Enterobacter huaxiensis TaxID=2494702 RepID=UPI002175C3A3|nr:antiterminator Q family protein [Enterobacter huaxiensis]MCS5452517.1 antiterminator Q family protein [Enterobacter huaxiensis]
MEKVFDQDVEKECANGADENAAPDWDAAELLTLWGRWARGGDNLDIKPMAMLAGSSEPGLPMMDDDTAFIFERGLTLLRQYDLLAFKVVRLHYAYGMSLRAIAKVHHVSHGTIWQRLQAAPTWIDGFFSGLYKANTL